MNSINSCLLNYHVDNGFTLCGYLFLKVYDLLSLSSVCLELVICLLL